MLSLNDGIPWNEGLIERFKDYWRWSYVGLTKMPWSVELLERYEDRLNWAELEFKGNRHTGRISGSFEKHLSRRVGAVELDRSIVIELMEKNTPKAIRIIDSPIIEKRLR